MKNLKTIALVVLLIAGFTSTTIAQFSIGAKAGVAIPVGSFGQIYNMGFGGHIYTTYSLNDHMSVGLNAGFYAFKGTDILNSTEPSSRIIPVFLDFKYFLTTEGFMPYVGAGLGMYTIFTSSTTPDIPANVVGGLTVAPAIPSFKRLDSSSKFGVSPTVGFWLGDAFKYGASVTYNITFSDASYIGINIGVIYALSN